MENMPTNFRVRMIRPETKIMRKIEIGAHFSITTGLEHWFRSKDF